MEYLPLLDRFVLAKTDLTMTAEIMGMLSPAAIDQAVRDWALPGERWSFAQVLRHWAEARD